MKAGSGCSKSNRDPVEPSTPQIVDLQLVLPPSHSSGRFGFSLSFHLALNHDRCNLVIRSNATPGSTLYTVHWRHRPGYRNTVLAAIGLLPGEIDWIMSGSIPQPVMSRVFGDHATRVIQSNANSDSKLDTRCPRVHPSYSNGVLVSIELLPAEKSGIVCVSPYHPGSYSAQYNIRNHRTGLCSQTQI